MDIPKNAETPVGVLPVLQNPTIFWETLFVAVDVDAATMVSAAGFVATGMVAAEI